MCNCTPRWSYLHVDIRGDKWFLCWDDGSKSNFGPYKRAQDAKGQLTRLKK